MLSPLKVPLATAFYALLGVLLARYWYTEVRWPLYVAIGAAVILSVGTKPLGRWLITRKPMLALRTFESYSWINGLLSAVAGCATILVTVELTALAGDKDPLKELVTQASAALTTLIAGLVVATKDVDESLGKRISAEFQSKFTVEGQPAAGKTALAPESESLIAVFTRYANGWTDWSQDTRTARAQSLEDNLDKDKRP